jgi:hypothetical protein
VTRRPLMWFLIQLLAVGAGVWLGVALFDAVTR